MSVCSEGSGMVLLLIGSAKDYNILGECTSTLPRVYLNPPQSVPQPSPEKSILDKLAQPLQIFFFKLKLKVEGRLSLTYLKCPERILGA